MRKYVIMGVQGSGKGTQAMLLAADLDLVHISVGDIFRWNVQHHTKLGAQVRRTMAGGELVGDDLVEGIVKTRLADHDWNFGFIIDGFPRNERQAEFFLESYDIDGVIHLEMPDSEVRRRVMARRLCAGCGMDYNLLASTPHTAGRCDVCGGELVTREDDTEEALAVRLRDYHQKTNPVLDIFRRKEYVVTVDARPGRDIVQKEIRERLGLPPLPTAGQGGARPRTAPRPAADAGCGSCSRPTRSRAPSARRTRPPRWPGGGARPGPVTRWPACRWPTAARAPWTCSPRRCRARAGTRSRSPARAGRPPPAPGWSCPGEGRRSSWPGPAGCRCWAGRTRSARPRPAPAS